MSVILIVILVIFIASILQYYSPNIDILIEDTQYRILLWYNCHKDDEEYRKYKTLLIIKRKKSMSIKFLVKLIVIMILLIIGFSLIANFMSESDTLNNLIGLGCIICICYTSITLLN